MSQDLIERALTTISSEPMPLDIALRLASRGAAKPDQGMLAEGVRVNIELREAFRRSLVAWDAAVPENNSWTGETQVNTRARRNLVYELLDLKSELSEAFDKFCPTLINIEQTVVIAKVRKEWYTSARRKNHNFYWSRYRQYLQEKDFDAAALQQVDDDTTNIVRRLSDPLSEESYPSRGLVIGYVQSGKTTNFTAMIAKAVDAGYRLVIVLAGTLDVLRNQTQRRLDMELVGKENILETAGAEPHDYSDDRDWKTKFTSYGDRPANLGGSAIDRLTSSSADYHRLRTGITALISERPDSSARFFKASNLFRTRTKIIVCKKNGPVLLGLLKDLKKVKDQLLDIPALIIDDESDQASVNTKRQPTPAIALGDRNDAPATERERTAINGRIVEILAQLPRAQYVGYTATPVANVFVDPNDEKDLFPRDFVISLKEPSAYFGASSFHDIDDVPDLLKGDVSRSNDAAFVRDIRSQLGADDAELRTALDLFVLTGAVKLYRARLGVPGDFRHHTMLIHMSHLQAAHQSLLERVRVLWGQGYYETGGANSRLEKLLETDIRPVNLAREPLLPLPAKFEDLLPDLAGFFDRCDATNPVSMVNGHEDSDQLDFDREAVWRIIVGGTKLSRGYTIEGLTISYFRRSATAQDSLLQMGRWFGYRKGYRDLPRLFIGREELMKRKKVDLLAAFKGVCKSERALRSDLAKYNEGGPGDKTYTPREIPPMVEAHFPEMMLTAKNKMQNARLQSENYGLRWVQQTAFSCDDAVNKRNQLHLDRLLRDCKRVETRFESEEGSFDATAGLASHEVFLRFLKSFEWQTHIPFSPKLAFLEGKHGDPGIEDWLVVLPKTKNTRETVQIGDVRLNVIERSRRGDSMRLDSIAGPNHRDAVRPINASETASILEGGARDFQSKTRGIALVFLVRDPADPARALAPAFELRPPGNNLSTVPKFTVESDSDDPFVFLPR
jgi:hypothetical protein